MDRLRNKKRWKSLFLEPGELSESDREYRSRFVIAACSLAVLGFFADIIFLVVDQMVSVVFDLFGIAASLAIMFIELKYRRPRLTGALLCVMGFTLVLLLPFNGLFFFNGSLRYIPVIAFCSVYLVSVRFALLCVLYVVAGLGFLDWASVSGLIAPVVVDPSTLKLQISIDTLLATFVAVGAASLYDSIRRAKDLQIAQQFEELENQQRVIEHQNQLSLLGRYAGQLAHDINNPLTVALMRNEKLLIQASRNILDMATIKEQLELVREDLYRIRDIVAGTRNFLGNPRTSEDRLLNLAEVVQRSLVLLEHKLKGEHVALEINVEDQTVFGNEIAIQQVIVNLITNALDSLTATPAARIKIYSRAYHKSIKLVVADNGPGVPLALVDKIFEPLFSTKGHHLGSGLGLPVSRDFMKKMGGDLMYAKDSEWTNFEMVFPIPNSHVQAC